MAGVDEAGLGPLLGPLAFGWSVLRLPSAAVDPWRELRGVVSRKPGRDRRRIAIADSKAVFSRNAPGRRRLELAALSFDALGRPAGRPPEHADGFVLGPLRPTPAALSRHPWYALLSTLPLPRTVERGTAELWTAKIRRALDRAGIEVLETGARVVPAGELNASFGHTASKSRTHWDKGAEVLRRLWDRHAGEGELDVAVDKHGARSHYTELLERAFPEAVVEELGASEARSEYQLVERRHPGGGGRRMRLTFCERAEERWFCVALASCLAKYARELTMEAFNAFFCGLQPDLRPTAGYTTDGRRWLRDARRAVHGAELGRDVLVRER